MARSPYLDWLADALVADPPRPVLAPGHVDMVLGYATGYGVPQVEAFVRSLRAVFHGHVALVVDDRPDLIAFLTAHGIEALHPEAEEGVWTPHPVVARFSAYARILNQRPEVRNVVITDVRDVIFQSDPFAEPVSELEFFVENEAASLSSHAFNMKHMRAMVGDGLVRAIQDRACVCVGVVVGPREAVQRFSRMILMMCAIPRSRVGGAFGADQAACNLLAHLGLLGGEVRGNYSRVATIGLTPGERMGLVDGGIVNPDASLSPIVHQYDRIPHLAAFVEQRWGQGGDATGDRAGPRAPRVSRWGASLLRRLPEWR